MTIRCKLLEEPGVTLDYELCVMTWEDAEVPMKLTDHEIEESHSMLQELTKPKQVREATSRMDKTLAAAHDKADSDKVTRSCLHLPPDDRTALNMLLKNMKTCLTAHWARSMLIRSVLKQKKAPNPVTEKPVLCRMHATDCSEKKWTGSCAWEFCAKSTGPNGQRPAFHDLRKTMLTGSFLTLGN